MSPVGSRHRRARGQIIVISAIAMVALIGGVALVLEGGNAYAQQRGVQNGADASANAGATVIAQQLGGIAKTDQNVFDAMQCRRSVEPARLRDRLVHRRSRPVHLVRRGGRRQRRAGGRRRKHGQ